jgi:hypothetical protein
MSMVEKVARVLYAVRVESAKEAGLDTSFTWETEPNVYREHCLREARAAIEAMREPTEAMKHATDEVHWGYSCAVCGGLTEGWYAMIDAALTPPKP